LSVVAHDGMMRPIDREPAVTSSPVLAAGRVEAVPFVEQGLVHLLFAYDVGMAIDLGAAQQQITDLTALAHIKHKGHAPTYFQFDPPPLRVTQEAEVLAVGRHRSAPSVDTVVYDFGGLSVGYTIPFQGSFDELIELSIALSASPLFRDDSRRRVEHLMAVIESAVSRAGIADLFEDYTIFQVSAFRGGMPAADVHGAHASLVARLLRSEHDPLSEQEIGDALANRISFGVEDVAIVDWNAALLYDKEPEDVRSVLEYANLQLLEMRYLDGELDGALDRAYEIMSRPRTATLRLPGKARAELRKVARMQVDAAILFERVGNALKLLGDQYLARVYRATSQRYRLAEWNSTILRKLETIESIYEKVHDHSANVRMEMLEWIIILLIAFEIVSPLFAKLFA
jgi:hypothetical protein